MKIIIIIYYVKSFVFKCCLSVTLYDRYYRLMDIFQANVLRLSFHWSEVNHLISNTNKWLTSLMGNEQNKPLAEFEHAKSIYLSRDAYHLHAKIRQMVCVARETWTRINRFFFMVFSQNKDMQTPPPPLLIRVLWKMRNVLKIMKN